VEAARRERLARLRAGKGTGQPDARATEPAAEPDATTGSLLAAKQRARAQFGAEQPEGGGDRPGE
jgi:hypothetical protein